MFSGNFDIAVLGGGCVGSSILFELTRQGFRNLVLVDCGRKSVSATSQSGGMLRVFHESPEHVELALAHRKILSLYDHQKIFTESFEPNGSLYFFKKKRLRGYAPSLNKMEAADYPFEVVEAAEGTERFPQFHWDHDDRAVFEPQGGHMSPQLFSTNLLNESGRRGAIIIDDFEVSCIRPYLDRYRLFGENGIITARTLILAGGARLLPRLNDLGLSLPLESKMLTTHIAEKNHGDFKIQNYFDRETLEFARFGPGKYVVLSGTAPARVKHQAWGEIIETRGAEDCYAPDRLGLVGQIPGHPRLILATGWGGTAFKFALEIGHRAVRSVERENHERRTSYAVI